MIRAHRFLFVVALIGSVALVGTAMAAKKPHDGQKLLGNKIHQNGKHELHKVGKHTAYAHVSKGKITGVTVENDAKGAVPVTKYKTDKKMAEVSSRYLVRADTGTMTDATLAQLQYVTAYVGYAYYDEFGDEYIYWFLVDLIYDGDTGAVLYMG
jgi:hypothetical protein